jgi:hypothetical protein
VEGGEMSEHSIESISVDESKRLIALEQTIKQGLDTFVEVGEALLEIRDSRLYRIEHGTFEEYCKGKWGMSRFHAYNLINGSKATKNVDNCQHKPTTESQARPLTKLPPEDQPKAWQKAVEIAGGEQPTAKQVSQAVVEISKADSSPRKLKPPQCHKMTPQEEFEKKQSDIFGALQVSWAAASKATKDQFLAWIERTKNTTQA